MNLSYFSYVVFTYFYVLCVLRACFLYAFEYFESLYIVLVTRIMTESKIYDILDIKFILNRHQCKNAKPSTKKVYKRCFPNDFQGHKLGNKCRGMHKSSAE